MTKKEIGKRYILFIIGLLFSGIGVAITKRGELGVSPISSVANIMSYKLPALTLGSWLLIWNCVLLLGQIILLRREFQLIQLLQIPLSVLFGCFTDFGVWIAGHMPNHNYGVRMLLVLVGIAILALGITLTVIADVVMNSGEALVKAISEKSGKSFGFVKVAFDISCVTVAVILSLVLFDGKLIGTREGTIIAALLTGTLVKVWQGLIKEPVVNLLTVKEFSGRA